MAGAWTDFLSWDLKTFQEHCKGMFPSPTRNREPEIEPGGYLAAGHMLPVFRPNVPYRFAADAITSTDLPEGSFSHL